jgi:quercetin dioxygenase-like cupin family protein
MRVIEEGEMSAGAAQVPGSDPVKVDSKHYKVVMENDRIRVVRATYGPGEKSVMHGHPESVTVFLNDGHAKFTSPDGKSEERTWKAGEVTHRPAEQHLPENASNKPIDVIVIEFKS